MAADWNATYHREAYKYATSATQLPVDAVQWNAFGRFLFLSALSTVGTVGNAFAISAVLLDEHLRRIGNAFIVNLAVADFAVSGFAIPASCVAILAGSRDGGQHVCRFQWAAAVLCYHVSVLSLMCIALESGDRIVGGGGDRSHRSRSRSSVALVLAAIWTASAASTACQFLLELGPDYCRMVFKGHLFYHVVVGVAFHTVPTVLTFAAYLRCLFALRDDRRLRLALGASSALANEVELMKASAAVFATFLACWLPLGALVAVGSVRPVSRRLYDSATWLAFANSCLNCYVYGLGHRHFKNSFAKLFRYCFCKTSVSFGPNNQQQQRTVPTSNQQQHGSTTSGVLQINSPRNDVRVHIIPGYNIHVHRTEPNRAGGAVYQL